MSKWLRPPELAKVIQDIEIQWRGLQAKENRRAPGNLACREAGDQCPLFYRKESAWGILCRGAGGWGGTAAARHIWHTGVWPDLPMPAISNHLPGILLLVWMESRKNYSSTVLMIFFKICWFQLKPSFLQQIICLTHRLNSLAPWWIKWY